jgi:hypothetical protein
MEQKRRNCFPLIRPEQINQWLENQLLTAVYQIPIRISPGKMAEWKVRIEKKMSRKKRDILSIYLEIAYL